MANLPSFVGNVRLSAREQKLLTGLGAVLGVALFIGLPIGIEVWTHSRKAALDDLKTALSAVQAARGQVAERKARKETIAHRYEKKAPLLAGYLEQTASAEKVQIADSQDRQEVPHGKKFTERSTEVHFKKVGMLPLAKVLEAIETSGYPVVISKFNLRKRPSDADQYDVGLTLSAFDRATTPSSEGKKEEAKP